MFNYGRKDVKIKSSWNNPATKCLNVVLCHSGLKGWIVPLRGLFIMKQPLAMSEVCSGEKLSVNRRRDLQIVLLELIVLTAGRQVSLHCCFSTGPRGKEWIFLPASRTLRKVSTSSVIEIFYFKDTVDCNTFSQSTKLTLRPPQFNEHGQEQICFAGMPWDC